MSSCKPDFGFACRPSHRPSHLLGRHIGLFRLVRKQPLGHEQTWGVPSGEDAICRLFELPTNSLANRWPAFPGQPQLGPLLVARLAVAFAAPTWGAVLPWIRKSQSLSKQFPSAGAARCAVKPSTQPPAFIRSVPCFGLRLWPTRPWPSNKWRSKPRSSPSVLGRKSAPNVAASCMSAAPFAIADTAFSALARSSADSQLPADFNPHEDAWLKTRTPSKSVDVRLRSV